MTWPARLSLTPRFRWALRLSKGLLLVLTTTTTLAQNSMVGDGFGGRLWYRPTNYTAGSYSAFSLCYSDPCDSSSNQLYGWGSDYQGELGNGPNANCSSVPVAIPGMSNVRYYSAGYFMGVIRNDSTGWIWSHSTYPFPTQVLTNVKHLDASNTGVSYVKHDGTVWSMGLNSSGEFGDGSTDPNFTGPVQMSGVNNAVRVASGGATNYVLLADSTVLSVGLNVAGLLGDPSITAPNTTEVGPVSELSQIVDIKAHSLATAALDANGDVYCWGIGDLCGIGQNISDGLPRRVTMLNNIVAISGCADGGHFLALDAYGNCYAWGDLNLGYSFVGAPVLTEPILIATNVIDIMAGELFSYIVKSDGSLWAMGSSFCGSIWLDQPNILSPAMRTELTQINPSLVPGSCPIVGTVAVPSSDCYGSCTITVSHFGGQAPYQYDIGSGPQSSNIFTGLVAGTYTVTVTDANGCVTTASCATDPSDVQPVLDLIGNVTICNDEVYTLPWGELVETAGTYTDTVFSNTGCDTVRVLTITEAPFIHASITDTICDGETYVLPSGNIVEFTATSVLDTVQFTNACDTVYHVQLVYGGTVAFIVSVDTVVEPGTTVTLLALGGGTNFSWYPIDGLNCSDCAAVMASPTNTTEYCVIASNDYFCPADTACIVITAISIPPPICTPSNIFVPTAFSPNGIGPNDLHCVMGGDCITSMSFGIYDRWGNKVFESTDPEDCWDGTFNGQALDPAVFVYHLIATLTNGEIVERQGNITLVR